MMVFFATYLYAFAKQHGDGWQEQLTEQLKRGPLSTVPSIRTWAGLTHTSAVMLAISGPCRIAPARSQDARRFLEAAAADVFVMCDDDVYCGTYGMSKLVEACRATRGFVVAPCLQRDHGRKADDPGICNIRVDLEGEPDVFTGDDYRLVRIKAPGMGLVAIHRDVIERLTLRHPELLVVDDGTGFEYSALFFEMIAESRWLGEDMSFGRRMRAIGVDMHALLGVNVEHAGRQMVLELDQDNKLAMRVFDLAGDSHAHS